MDPYARGIGATPAIVDPHVAAVSPAQFFKRLPECSYIAPLLGVILGEGTQYANPSDAVWCLPPRRERPRRRAADQDDEIPPPHEPLPQAQARPRLPRSV